MLNWLQFFLISTSNCVRRKFKKIAHKLGKDGKVIPEHDFTDDYKNTS